MPTAWRRERDGRLTPTELATATPGPGRVTIAVEAVAVDRADATPAGRVPGVAAVGRVTAVGVAADEWLGARVLVPSVDACGECDRCRRGGAAVCADGGRRGVTAPGALATELTAAARWLVRLDGALALPAPAAAALGGELARGYALYARASVGPRDPVVVVGGGLLARATVEVLLQKGAAPVCATDDAATIAALAGRAAVTTVHTAAIEDALGAGARPRRVLVTDAALLEAGLRVAGPRATVVVAAGDRDGDVAPPLAIALANEVTLAGVLDCHPDLLPEVAALAARGDLALDTLVEVVPVGALADRLAARAHERPATALVATVG